MEGLAIAARPLQPSFPIYADLWRWIRFAHHGVCGNLRNLRTMLVLELAARGQFGCMISRTNTLSWPSSCLRTSVIS